MGKSNESLVGFFPDDSLEQRVKGHLRRRRGLNVSIPDYKKTGWSRCLGCPMNDGRPKVPSTGNPDTAELAVVGIYPGEDEERRYESFCGPAGGLLKEAYRDAGWSDRQVWLGNVVKCRPRSGEFEAAEIRRIAERCGGYVEDELVALPRLRAIVLAGEVPLSRFVGRGGISIDRGILRRDASLPAPYFPVFNPAMFLNQERHVVDPFFSYDTFKADFDHLFRWASGPRSPTDCRFCQSKAQVTSAVNTLLSETGPLYIDVETPGLEPWRWPLGQLTILSLGASASPGIAYGFALSVQGAPVDPVFTFGEISRLLAGPQEKGALNGQHDLHWLEWCGARVNNFRHDVMHAAGLLAYRPFLEMRSGLSRLAADWLGEIDYPHAQVDKTRMQDYSAEEIVQVAMTDAEWERRLHDPLLQALEDRVSRQDPLSWDV